MSDMSQNYNPNQQFAMGPFNVFPKRNYLYFKVYLRDEFENPYIHEDLNTADAIVARLSNTTVETPLTFTRVGQGKATFAQIYKITVTNIAQFALTREGLYQIKLVSTALGTTTFSLYIRDNRTSAGYVAPRGSPISVKTRERAFSQVAGKFFPV
jgi:hypothetical protein